MYVDIDRVGHRFAGGPWLFRRLSARLGPGRSYALTGPSGSGKSTLLGLVAGWLPPTEGRITAVGVRKTARVFQNPHGMPRRTAVDHVALPVLAAGASRAEADAVAHDLLERFGLGDRTDRAFRELSGGEAQRLMFARAIASRPQLLLIDEPTAQLDSSTSRRLNAVIGRLRDEGRIVIVASHDPETVAACDERIDLASFADSGDSDAQAWVAS